MISEIDELRSSVPFWDDITAWTAFILLIGATGPIVIEFTNFIVSSLWKSRIRVLSTVLLIAGTGGQIGAQLRIAAISSRIVAVLDERAKQLEKDVEKLKADNLAQAVTIIDLTAKQNRQGDQVDTAVVAVSNAVTTASVAETKAKAADTRTRPRELDPDDVFLNVTGRKYRGSRVVTVIRLSEPEPYQYANKLLRGLERGKFKITVEEPRVPFPYVGTLLCEAPGASTLSRVLNKASAYNKILRHKDKEWPDVCTKRTTGVFGESFVTRSGLVIFVGHNPQVVK